MDKRQEAIECIFGMQDVFTVRPVTFGEVDTRQFNTGTLATPSDLWDDNDNNSPS